MMLDTTAAPLPPLCLVGAGEYGRYCAGMVAVAFAGLNLDRAYGKGWENDLRWVSWDGEVLVLGMWDPVDDELDSPPDPC